MRVEFLNFVENQRTSQFADGKYDLLAAQEFKYKALMNELHVGDVFLRMYNEQPDLEIINGLYLYEALVDFIWKTIEDKQKLLEAEIQTDLEPTQTHREAETSANSVPPVPTKDEIDSKVFTGDIETGGEGVPLALTLDLSSCSYELPGTTLVKNLTVALKSWQNILNSDSELTIVFSSIDRLSPLLRCLIETGPSCEQVPKLCLNVLARLTVEASCVETLVADRSVVLLLLQLLHCALACRPGALRVLYSLASTSELAWAAAKHGGVMYILQLILPGLEVSSQAKISAASLLGKLVGQPIHGPRVAITVGRFLPDGLVSVIRDGPGEAVVAVLQV